MYAAHDGYVYAGGVGGEFRALVSALVSNPSNSGAWQDLTGSWPTSSGSPLDVSYYAEGPNGEIFAGAGVDTSNVYCAACSVAKFDSNTSTWTTSNHFQPGYETRGIDFDANGAIWAAAQQRGIFKSTDGGATFNVVVTDPYGNFGQTTGWVYGMSIINNQLYWGGEGALNATPISFASDTVETGGSGYSLNQYHVASNGTQTTPASEIFSVGRTDGNGSPVQHYLNGVWSDVNAPATQYWQVHMIVKGSGAHEYYYAGKHGTAGGVAATSDGLNWSLINNGLPSGEQQNVDWMTVSPLTDNLFITFETSSSYGGELWMR